VSGTKPADESDRISSNAPKFPSDSAYASASLTGSGPSTRAQSQPKDNDKSPTRISNKANDRRVESYLRGITKKVSFMSERTKMKIVVTRLEKLFTGGLPILEPTGHTKQQQEISKSADSLHRRHRGNSTGSGGGFRQANILSASESPGPVLLKRPRLSHTPPSPSPSLSRDSSGESLTSNSDQRPTRPLDLDPHRKQVPAENVEYIRHLVNDSDRDVDTFGINGGEWVWLNLLVNMAQLHDMNVTPEFVKRAVIRLSTQLEVSQDGQKLRWLGGTEGTVLSNDSSDRLEGSPDVEGTAGATSRKAGRSPGGKRKAHPSSSGTTNNVRTAVNSSDLDSEVSDDSIDFSLKMGPVRHRNHRSDTSFGYKPLFIHRNSSSEVDTGEATSASRDSAPRHSGENLVSIVRASGSQSMSISRQKRKRQGPMIFYKDAKFCIDLSSGKRKKGPLSPPTVSYTAISTTPLGAHPSRPQALRTGSGNSSFGHPLNRATTEHLESDPYDEELEKLIPQAAMLSVRSPNTQRQCSNEIVNFEFSGIGGCLPADNFLVDVETSRGAPPASTKQKPSLEGLLKKLRQRQSGFHDSDPSPSNNIPAARPHELQILSVRATQLPPSELPPASYIDLSQSETDSQGDSDKDSSEFTYSSRLNAALRSEGSNETSNITSNELFDELGGNEDEDESMEDSQKDEYSDEEEEDDEEEEMHS
jgi:Frequency clock protein